MLIKFLSFVFSILLSAYLLPGVSVGIWGAIWVAILLGIINVTLKPFLIFITLPINILSLGLFTFIINAFLILLLSTIVKGFEVSGFGWAILFGILMSVINYFLNKFID